MVQSTGAIEAAIKARIVELADGLGSDARGLEREDLIPATGFIDSAGLLELIAWYEMEYQITVTSEEFTIDNLGTLASMAEFVLRKKAAS